MDHRYEVSALARQPLATVQQRLRMNGVRPATLLASGLLAFSLVASSLVASGPLASGPLESSPLASPLPASGLPVALAAAPTTAVAYSKSASSTTYTGLAFDQCTAPSLPAMQAWDASPYRAIGVYIGGINRTCAQPELTATWVTAVSARGWKLIPIYKGLQPACGARPTDQKITPSGAAGQGTAAADDAIASATARGMLPGSAIYNDIENYSTTDSSCRTAVLTYLSAWTTRLHAKGYVSGVYVNLSSGAQDLARVYSSGTYARPDAIWIARYDGDPALTGWPGISSNAWPLRQRAKQFVGNTTQTYGGVSITIDRNQFDAPVATVSYRHLVTSTTALSGRSGPFTSAPVSSTHPPGSAVKIACQSPGSAVGTTKVWNKLTNGAYVTDLYLDTPSSTTYSPPISRCTYPYQVTTPGGVTTRKGPGTTFASAGGIPAGGLVRVTCQRAGTPVQGTKIWDKLIDGRWVTDAYVGTPSKTTYSAVLPRC
jgi:uncharacterized protein YraI